MTKSEMIAEIKKYAEQNLSSLPFWADSIAVRYDDKDVQVGDELECSLDNVLREDSREYPSYGDDCPRLPGTSCYGVCTTADDEDDLYVDFLDRFLADPEESRWRHCSIVIGSEVPSTECAPEDDGEVILSGCEVVKKLW